MGGCNTRPIAVLRMGGGGVCQIACSLPVSTCAVREAEKCVFIIFYGESSVCTDMFVRCRGWEQVSLSRCEGVGVRVGWLCRVENVKYHCSPLHGFLS